MKPSDLPVPTEDQEQIWLFEWATLAQGKYPELALMHHIPNGGSRHKAEAVKLKRMGVKRGVPDISLPVPKGGCNGLYIELKRTKGGAVTKEQTAWMDALTQHGYMVALCKGWEQARDVIEQYLGGAK